MADMIFKVRAMYCEQCIASVVSAISVVRGVHYVTVSPRYGEIAVGYDQGTASAEQLKRAAGRGVCQSKGNLEP